MIEAVLDEIQPMLPSDNASVEEVTPQNPDPIFPQNILLRLVERLSLFTPRVRTGTLAAANPRNKVVNALESSANQLRKSIQLRTNSFPSRAPRIQSVASLLGTRSLVLITFEQQVLDVLTAEQEVLLKSRIARPIRSYGLHRRLKSARRQLVSSLKRLSPQPLLEVLKLPAHKDQTSAVPVLQRLWGTGKIDRVQPQPPLESRRENSGLSAPGGQIITIPNLSIAAKIQGIASRLSNQHLVLITVDQEILDVLTPWQQARLRHRIAWAMGVYGVRLQLRRARQWLAPSSSRSQPGLLNRPQVRLNQAKKISVPAFSALKDWVMHSIIGAIATLPIVAIPAVAAESVPQPTVTHDFSEEWVDPSQLRPRLSWDELQGMTFQQTHGNGWLTKQRRSNGSEAASNQSAQASLKESFYTSDDGIEIPVEAEFLGYDPHLLEQVLGWLDGLLVQIEAIAEVFWRWLGIVTVAGLSALHGIRQRIFS
ncbi:MAG: hypothetical protein AAGB01_12155 [Cyanobacteria bacterium P01_F01_bin.42]